MLTCLQCGLANGYMPMVWGPDNDGIDSRFFVEQVAIIVKCPSLFQLVDLQCTTELSLVNVTNGDDLLIQFIEFRNQIAPHLTAHPNARKRQFLVRRLTGQQS